MAAVIKIYELSASMAGTDKTSSTIRFKLANNVTIDAVNPMTIPVAATNFSFTKHARMYCATAPGTSIDNLQVYTDGAGFGTGITVNASNHGGTFTANASLELSADIFDLFTKVSGAAVDLDAVHTSAVTATGFMGDILCMQMGVTTTATSGTKTAETVTWVYDEI